MIFALFYCLLDLRSGECDVWFVFLCQWICLFCVFRVCELFGDTIRNMLGVFVILLLKEWSCWVEVLY